MALSDDHTERPPSGAVFAPKPILIAGPTASGKSALAVEIARRTGGVVINADSMQVYGAWRVLTARPSPEEEAAADHRLYGHTALDADYSVGAWLAEITPILTDLAAAGRPAVIVGGTGLYFKALTQGLAEIPPVPRADRDAAEALLHDIGRDAFYQHLLAADPEAARMRDPQNPMRLIRAWSVLQATGRSLFHWTDATPPPLVPLDQAHALVLEPPRDWLNARCDMRFDMMMAGGALEEARAVAEMAPPPDALGLKAVGGPELLAYVRGDISLEDAAAAAKLATRQYAKRQQTWFRNQTRAWRAVKLEEYCDTDAFSAHFLQAEGYFLKSAD